MKAQKASAAIDPQTLLAGIARRYKPGEVAISFSGAEDVVLIDMAHRAGVEIADRPTGRAPLEQPRPAGLHAARQRRDQPQTCDNYPTHRRPPKPRIHRRMSIYERRKPGKNPTKAKRHPSGVPPISFRCRNVSG